MLRQMLSMMVLIVRLKMIPAQDPRDLMFFAMLSGTFIAGNYFEVRSDKKEERFSERDAQGRAMANDRDSGDS